MATSTTGNFTGIVNQSTSLFDAPTVGAATLLQLQTVATNPFVTELPTATGLLLPDVASYDRLSHFPEGLYDLRPSSHLVRFVSTILGDSGVGQLRKRYSMAQFEQSLNSTHFYDLDRFYGALFGARRGALATLPVDPTTSVATSDGWDSIKDLDSVFRERIIKLARAITLGGTPGGMQALAEALTGVECDIYENWQLIDTEPSAGGARTYAQVGSAYANYGAMKTMMWSQVSGVVHFGNLAIDARNEFLVRPKTVYNVSDPADAVRRAEDLYGVQRVIQVLKPVNTLATVDDQGLAVHQKVPIRSVSSDSEFWEVVSRVVPTPKVAQAYQVAYQAYDGRGKPVQVQVALPRPPFSSSQGQEWSYVNEVSSIRGYQLPSANSSFDITAKSPNIYQTVQFYDGKKISYRPEYALIDSRQSAATQVTGSGALQVHPYSGPRKLVPTHG